MKGLVQIADQEAYRKYDTLLQKELDTKDARLKVIANQNTELLRMLEAEESRCRGREVQLAEARTGQRQSIESRINSK